MAEVDHGGRSVITLAVIVYAALSLIVCLPAGRIMQRFPEMRSAKAFVLVVAAWPIIMICGLIAYAISPDARKRTRETVGLE
jgi:MFS family permease